MSDICYPKSAALLSVEQAQQRICQTINPIEEYESIELTQALGRILQQNIVSPMAIPPQRNAAMDGYAFSSSALIDRQVVELEVIGTSWAGKPFLGTATPNQCVRIFTGAVVPDFADSVIPQEQVTRQDNQISLPENTKPFKNIRAAGSDVQQHELLISAPKKLKAGDLGLLAAAGIEQVQVTRPLKIGFFSTGDELVAVGQALQPGQIYDSNRYLLVNLLKEANHQVTDLGVIKDDCQLIEQTFITAADEFDVLISTGGASVGDADFIKQTLEQCGQVNFWKLAIKPGKPLAFGKINDCIFFGLPGNPVAVMVTFEKFVKPALQQLSGVLPTQALQLLARCDTPLRKTAGRQEYQRGILSQISPGEFSVKAAGQQDSHQLKVASLANCFIVLDSECTGVEAGEMVMVEPLDIRI